MKKKLLLLVFSAMIILIPVKLSLSAEVGPDSATCAVSVTVDSIIEWEGAAFPALVLAAITQQNSAPEDNDSFTLWTNCNVTLSANNTAASQLTDGTDVLITKYKLTTDGDGTAASGADGDAVTASGSDAYALHNSFLTTPLAITHVNADGNVEVTLYAQATNDTDEVSDSGDYSATQTITATWASDD